MSRNHKASSSVHLQMVHHAGRDRLKVRVLFLFAVFAIFSASSSEEADLLGAGNSERVALLGDDDRDDSIEDILRWDVSEAEAMERVQKAFAKKRSSEGKEGATVLDASAEVSHQSTAISRAGGNSEHAVEHKQLELGSSSESSRRRGVATRRRTSFQDKEKYIVEFQHKAKYIVDLRTSDPVGYKWTGHGGRPAVDYFAEQIKSEHHALKRILAALVQGHPHGKFEYKITLDKSYHHKGIAILMFSGRESGVSCTADLWLALAVCPEVEWFSDDISKTTRNADCSKCSKGFMLVETDFRLTGKSGAHSNCHAWFTKMDTTFRVSMAYLRTRWLPPRIKMCAQQAQNQAKGVPWNRKPTERTDPSTGIKKGKRTGLTYHLKL